MQGKLSEITWGTFVVTYITCYITTLKEPRLLARVDAKLLQILSKLQILLDKGKVTFNNNNNKRKRFQLLNFPRAAILDLMTPLRCLYCWKAEVLLFETIHYITLYYIITTLKGTSAVGASRPYVAPNDA